MVVIVDELERVKSEVIAFGTAQDWLDSRWDELNTYPPVPLLTANSGEQQTVNENIDVVVDSIVDGGEAHQWGGVNNRGDSYRQIVQGLIDSDHPSFDDWFSQMGRLHLFRHHGPNGPIYETGNSRHRVHTVKAMRLTRFQARVEFEYSPLAAGDEVVISIDSPEKRRHAEAIAKLGWIDEAPPAYRGMFSPRLSVDLPYTWALEPDANRRRINEAYARVYPNFIDTLPEVIVGETRASKQEHRSLWQHIRSA